MLNNNDTIKEKIEIPKIRLWVIWFMLFVLPSLIAIIGYKAYVKEYLFFAHTDLVYKSYEIIRNYNESIVPENYMSDKLEILSGLDNNAPETLKSQIDDILCGESLLCLFFDEKLDNIKLIKSNKIDKSKYKIPPIALLKSNLRKFIEAELNTTIPKLSGLQKANIIKQLGQTLQQMFKTATVIPISSNKVSKNFSVTYGGELYFVYNVFKKPNNNYYGFLAVMQGRYFDFHKMLRRQNTIFPNARIVFKDMEIKNATINKGVFYSGITHDNEGITITVPTSDKFIRHVVHSGSEELNPGYGTLFPFVEYHVPMETIYQELFQNNNKLKIIALLIILVSGIYTLHVCLFGFQKNLSFKRKILYLTLIASLFPFCVFFAGNYSFSKYEEFIAKTSVIQHAETELELANQELEQYLTSIEVSMTQACNDLSSELAQTPLKPSSVLDSLSKIGNKHPVSTLILYFKDIPDELGIIAQGNKVSKRISENTSEELLADEDESIVNLIPAVIFETINDTKEEIEKEENRVRKDLYIFGNNKIPIPKLNLVIKNDGSLMPFDQITMPTWYIMQMIPDPATQNYTAMLIAKFEPRPLLAYFLKDSILARKNFKETKDNFEINYSFLPTEKSGSAPIWSGSGNISESDRKLCLNNVQSERLETNDNGNKIIIKKNNQKIPHLAVAIINERSNQNEQTMILKLLLAIIGYLLLILYLSSKLFDLMFIEPVSLLASSAGAIARGHENWNADINSGDEFEDLNNNFKQLVTGLKERNLLKSYVSEDAFSDIEGTNSLKYLPGGEYKEATIVFSAIKEYDKLTSNLQPQEVIKLLSKYVSIAEEVVKTYGGSLDKILGETIMLVFRDDPEQESHGLRAAHAALDFVEKMKNAGFPRLYTGIASGTVISGKIGSYSGKLDFTVIGNPVNLAARFKAESKRGTESTGIIISGITIGLMNGRGRVKFLRRVSIKGKARKYNIYELLSLR